MFMLSMFRQELRAVADRTDVDYGFGNLEVSTRSEVEGVRRESRRNEDAFRSERESKEARSTATRTGNGDTTRGK